MLPEVGQAAEQCQSEHGRDGCHGSTDRAEARCQERSTDSDVSLDGQQNGEPDGRHQGDVGQDGGVDGVDVERVGLVLSAVSEEGGEQDEEDEIRDGQRHQVAVGRRAHRLATKNNQRQQNADDSKHTDDRQNCAVDDLRRSIHR